MGKYVLRRILIAIPTLLGVTMLIYLFINLAPGDPISVMLSPEQMANAGPNYLQQARERLGLNQPIPVRYVIWLKEMLRGNWGYSIQFQKPVLQRVTQRLSPTLRLSIASLLIALLLGIPIGILSAVKQYSVLDYVITVFSFVGVSIPVFFLGLALIYTFSLKLNLLPPGGMETIGKDPTLRDTLTHLILPATMLAAASVASFARYTRASMLDVIRQEYLQTARAKGLREIVVFVKHAFPNAMMPIITVIGLQLPSLFAGAVITEYVFSWPGMGRLAIEAINYRDYPLLMGITTIFAVLVLISNIVTDVAYATIDPRIRYD